MYGEGEGNEHSRSGKSRCGGETEKHPILFLWIECGPLGQIPAPPGRGWTWEGKVSPREAVWGSYVFRLTTGEAIAQEILGAHRSEAGGTLGRKVPCCCSPVPGLSLASSKNTLWAGCAWYLTLKQECSLLPLPVPVFTECRPGYRLVSTSHVRQKPRKRWLVRNDFIPLSCQNTVFVDFFFLNPGDLQHKLHAFWPAALLGERGGRSMQEETDTGQGGAHRQRDLGWC